MIVVLVNVLTLSALLMLLEPALDVNCMILNVRYYLLWSPFQLNPNIRLPSLALRCYPNMSPLLLAMTPLHQMPYLPGDAPAAPPHDPAPPRDDPPYQMPSLSPVMHPPPFLFHHMPSPLWMSTSSSTRPFARPPLAPRSCATWRSACLRSAAASLADTFSATAIMGECQALFLEVSRGLR